MNVMPINTYPWRSEAWQAYWQTACSLTKPSPLYHASVHRVRDRLRHDLFGTAVGYDLRHPTQPLNWEQLERLGLFDDGLDKKTWQAFRSPSSWSLAHRCHASLPSLHGHERPLVGVMPGCFAPVHEGHLSAMDLAIEAWRSQGWNVVDVRASPTHDAYARSKPKAMTWSAYRRWACLEESLLEHRKHSRLDVPLLGEYAELWDAPTALQYTDVLARLRSWLDHLGGRQVTIGVIVGEDNAAFAEVLAPHYPVVIVGRTGQALPVVASSVIALPRHHPQSSSRVRGVSAKSSSVSVSSQPLVSESAFFPSSPPPSSSVILLKDEGLWAVQHWQQKWPHDPWSRRWNGFVTELESALVEATGLPVMRVPYARVVQWWKRRLPEHSIGVVDTFLWDHLPKEWKDRTQSMPLPCVRLFDRRQQSHPVAYVPPSSRSPASHFIHELWDDDVASGGTLRAVRAHAMLPLDLPAHGVLQAWLQAHHPQVEALDVVDARDFALGSWQGGLGVKLEAMHPVPALSGQASWGRVPYWAPWVNLLHRSVVPLSHQSAFTERVIRAHRLLWGKRGGEIRVGDLDEAAQRWWLHHGCAQQAHLTETSFLECVTCVAKNLG